METWLTHPYAHFAFYVYGICVNVHGIYTMYNVNVLTIQWCIKLPSLNEGIQLIFKNSLDHFPLPRMGDIPHTHLMHFIDLVYDHSINYLPLNEGIQPIFKNSLDHFPLPRMRDIPYKYYVMTHSSYAFY